MYQVLVHAKYCTSLKPVPSRLSSPSPLVVTTMFEIHAGKHSLTLVFVETKKGSDSLEYWLCSNRFPLFQQPVFMETEAKGA